VVRKERRTKSGAHGGGCILSIAKGDQEPSPWVKYRERNLTRGDGKGSRGALVNRVFSWGGPGKKIPRDGWGCHWKSEQIRGKQKTLKGSDSRQLKNYFPGFPCEETVDERRKENQKGRREGKKEEHPPDHVGNSNNKKKGEKGSEKKREMSTCVLAADSSFSLSVKSKETATAGNVNAKRANRVSQATLLS